MQIKTLTQYLAADNSTHNTRRAAILHNHRLVAKKRLMATLSTTLSTMRPDAVIGQILEEGTTIRNILNEYLSHLPKNSA